MKVLGDAVRQLHARMEAAGVQRGGFRNEEIDVSPSEKGLLFVGLPFTLQEAATASEQVFEQVLRATRDRGQPFEDTLRAAIEQSLVIGALAALGEVKE